MIVSVDRIFADPRLAAIYDDWCLGRPDFAFYLPLVMEARSVLDIGCGTGELLRTARRQGHTGRLAGLDPAAAMLDVARQQGGIEWHLGDPASMRFEGEFDLIVMTGHAFQVLLGDEELRESLQRIKRALTADGRFVFETRNPRVRIWERWPGAVEFEHDGAPVRIETTIDKREGELLTFTHSVRSPDWLGALNSTSTLRFLNLEALGEFLREAGFEIEAQYGGWDGSPLTPRSEEIITVAR